MKTHLLTFAAFAFLAGCASGYDNPAPDGTGGQAATETGGATAVGGASSGGAPGTGGMGAGGAVVIASTGGAVGTGGAVASTGGMGGAVVVASTGGAGGMPYTGPMWGKEVATNPDGSIRACAEEIYTYQAQPYPIGFRPDDGQYNQTLPLGAAVPKTWQNGWKNGFEAWHCAGVTSVSRPLPERWECSPRPNVICLAMGPSEPGFMWVTFQR